MENLKFCGEYEEFFLKFGSIRKKVVTSVGFPIENWVL